MSLIKSGQEKKKSGQRGANRLLWRWMKGATGQGMGVASSSWKGKTGSFREPPERNPALLTPRVARVIRSLGLITAKCLSWCLARIGCLTNGHSDDEDVPKCWIPLNYLNGRPPGLLAYTARFLGRDIIYLLWKLYSLLLRNRGGIYSDGRQACLEVTLRPWGETALVWIPVPSLVTLWCHCSHLLSELIIIWPS